MTNDISQRNDCPTIPRRFKGFCWPPSRQAWQAATRSVKSEGNGAPISGARKHAVKNSRTFLPCWRQVAATPSTRSTNRLPHSLAVQPLDFRHNTACRRARSAALFVGSIPGTLRKVHRCPLPSSNLRHVAAVFLPPQVTPRPSTCRTAHRIGRA
jgi:hypothetical protein